MKYKLIIVLMLGLLLIGFVFGQSAETSSASDEKKLTDYLGTTESENIQAIRTFGELPKDKKDAVWDSANGAAKDYFIERLSTKISEVQMQSISGNFGDFLKNNYLAFNNILQKQGVKIENFEAVNSLAKTIGINLDNVLNVRIESVNGFDNSALKWAEKGNIIGDGKVWLNLEGMPIGTSSLEYKDGRFILGNKDGGKIILEEGATNEKGEIIALSKYKNKFDSKMEIRKLGDLDLKKLQEKFSTTGLNEKGIVDLMRPTEGSFSLRNLMITNGKGEILLNEKGFEIKGDGTKVKYGDFNFGRVEGEKSQSLVEFGFDRVVLKGTEFKREGYAQVASTADNFIVHFGNPDGLANQISLIDNALGEGKVPAGLYILPESLPQSSEIKMKFDETGRLTHISKDKVSNGQFIPVTLSLSGDSLLAEIYKSSSYGIKTLLESANKGDVGYWDVWSSYYQDSLATTHTSEIKTIASSQNFLNMDGENFNVGGSGTVKMLKELNSITGTITNNFEIEDGNGKIKFIDGNIVMPGEQGAFNNGFKVGNIDSMDSRETSNEQFSIEKKDNALIHSKSDYLSAGRQTFLGPAGTSADVSMEFKSSEISKIKEFVGSSESGDLFVLKAMETNFKLNLDLFIPAGSSIDGDMTRNYVEKNINGLIKNPDSVANIIKPELRDSLINIATQYLNDNKNFRTGTLSLSIQNNPTNNPTLSVSFSGENIKNIDLNENQQGLMMDALQGSLRTPRINELTQTIKSYNEGRRIMPVLIWPPQYLSRLWYQEIGAGTRSGSLSDLNFLLKTQTKYKK